MLQVITELKKCNQDKSMAVRSERLKLQNVFCRTQSTEFKETTLSLNEFGIKEDAEKIMDFCMKKAAGSVCPIGGCGITLRIYRYFCHMALILFLLRMPLSSMFLYIIKCRSGSDLSG